METSSIPGFPRTDPLSDVFISNQAGRQAADNGDLWSAYGATSSGREWDKPTSPRSGAVTPTTNPKIDFSRTHKPSPDVRDATF